ncbi:MAG: hypothetical protein ACRDND_17275 [Streptosporangiaceae bacterium]
MRATPGPPGWRWPPTRRPAAIPRQTPGGSRRSTRARDLGAAVWSLGLAHRYRGRYREAA